MSTKKDLLLFRIATYLYSTYGYDKSYSDFADPRDIPSHFIQSATKIYNIIFKGED